MGLTLFDLRRRGKVDKLSMVGVNGTKFPAIREKSLDLITITTTTAHTRQANT